MNDREMVELAALPAIMQNLICERRPKHDDMKDRAWCTLFVDASCFAQRFGDICARGKRD